MSGGAREQDKENLTGAKTLGDGGCQDAFMHRESYTFRYAKKEMEARPEMELNPKRVSEKVTI